MCAASSRGKRAAARFERGLECCFDAADERRGESKMSPHQGYLLGRRIVISTAVCREWQKLFIRSGIGHDAEFSLSHTDEVTTSRK